LGAKPGEIKVKTVVPGPGAYSDSGDKIKRRMPSFGFGTS